MTRTSIAATPCIVIFLLQGAVASLAPATPRLDVFEVSPETGVSPALSSNRGGTVVAAWSSTTGQRPIMGRLLTADGDPIAPPFVVANGILSSPFVGMEPTSTRFAVTYEGVTLAQPNVVTYVAVSRYDLHTMLGSTIVASGNTASGTVVLASGVTARDGVLAAGFTLRETFGTLTDNFKARVYDGNGVLQRELDIANSSISDLELLSSRLVRSAWSSNPGIQTTRESQGPLAVAATGTGASLATNDADLSLIVWRDNGIWARLYSESGAILGPLLAIAPNTSTSPSVGTDGSGFAVSWRHGKTIFARLFDFGGNALTAPWIVSSDTGTGTNTPVIVGTQPGVYTAAWRNTAGKVVGRRMELGSDRLLALSARGFVGTGESVLIGGLIINGTRPRCVLVRALGPTLSAFGVSGVLANPTLQLFDQSNGRLIATNDDWMVGRSATDIRDIVDTGFPPPADVEPAILAVLPPGGYTAVVSGIGPLPTGIALVEIYEACLTPASLLALSTRAFVGNGDDVLIGGTVIAGNGTTRVLIRGQGPSLGGFGIANFLANPEILVFDGQGNLIAQNDDWRAQSAQQVQAIIATGKAPQNNLESALLLDLPAGSFTPVLVGVGGTTGVGIVEMFEEN